MRLGRVCNYIIATVGVSLILLAEHCATLQHPSYINGRYDVLWLCVLCVCLCGGVWGGVGMC